MPFRLTTLMAGSDIAVISANASANRFKSSSVLLEPYNPAFVTAQGGRFKSSSVLLEPFAIVAVVARSTVF